MRPSIFVCSALLLAMAPATLLSAQSTSTVIANTPSAVTAGAGFNLSAAVAVNGNSLATAPGSVTFYDGGISLGNTTVQSVAATPPTVVTFAQMVGTIDASATGTLAAADFNGDGKTDVISYSGTAFQVFLRNSASTGVLYQSLPVQTYALTQPVFLDFNHDGKMDIVTNSSSSLSVFAGNGAGVFAAPVAAAGIAPHSQTPTGLPASFTSLTSSVVTGSGLPYLLAGDRMVDPTYSQQIDLAVSSYRNNGDGTFSFVGIYPVVGTVTLGTNQITNVQTADVTGDGKPDLLVTVLTRQGIVPSTVYVLPGNGDGSFGAVSAMLTVQNTCSSSCGSLSLVTGDFNGDNKTDIAMTISTNASVPKDLYVFAGNGDGTFATPQISSTVLAGSLNIGSATGYFASIIAEDINGDGKVDLFDSMGYGYLSNGDLTFTPTANLAGKTYTSATAQMAGQIVAADFDGDSLQDVYLSLPGVPAFNIAASPLFVLGQVHGLATLSTSLALGVHNITATYSGGGGYLTSTSAAYPITATAPVSMATMTALQASPNPVVAGVSTTLTATVTGAQASAPTGNVVFSNGSTMLGTVALVHGVATLSTSFSTAGTQTVTANYAGDAGNIASSGTVAVTVQSPFTAQPSGGGSTTITVSAGGSANVPIAVTAQSGFTGTVSFACTGLPSGASCSFNPASVAVTGSTGGSTTLTVTTTQSMSSLGESPLSRGAGILCAGLLLGCVGFASRRRIPGALLVVAMMIGLGVLAGCSGNSSSAHSFTFNVVASSGAVQSTTAYTLNVQ